MSAEFLVLCPFGADPGLITKACELAEGTPVQALVPDPHRQQAAQYGAAVIHTLPDGFDVTDEAAFAKWLKTQLSLWGSTVVLAPATVRMRSIMPLLAWELGAGLTADCTALSMESDRLIQTRPAFGNSLMADIKTASPIQLATVRPGTFPPREMPVDDPRILPEQPPVSGRVQLLEQTAQAGGMPLAQASIVIAGGMGVGSRQGFEKLERLASKLGGAVAASRSAVDAGFAPYRCQVGLTGAAVSPKLYLAVGISGAVQHLAGMSGAQTVIAVNCDPKAPIFDYADYGVVADWETVVDKLLEE